MILRSNVQFKTEDQVTLRGWLYTPEKSEAPGIVMSHGFSALKEHHLAKFAEVFVEAGMYVLIYDHRNFGESDGDMPFEVDVEWQIKDMRHAISFLQSLPGILPEKIGLWGTSFSAGHVITLAAQDKRVKAAVLQVPFVTGHHQYLKETQPDLWKMIQKKYVADQIGRLNGMPPVMTYVVTENPQKTAVMSQPEAFEFFTSVSHWKNQVTLKSLENAGDYYPINVLDQVSIPLLFIIAGEDTICPTKLALQAFEKAHEPKECLMIPGEHFAPFDSQFDECATAACKWFKKYLLS